MRNLKTTGEMLWSIAFSRDARLLVAAGIRLTVWDGETGHLLLQLPADQLTSSAFFADNGRTLLSFGQLARREPLLVDDVSIPPEKQLAEVLAKYRLRLQDQGAWPTTTPRADFERVRQPLRPGSLRSARRE